MCIYIYIYNIYIHTHLLFLSFLPLSLSLSFVFVFCGGIRGGGAVMMVGALEGSPSRLGGMAWTFDLRGCWGCSRKM